MNYNANWSASLRRQHYGRKPQPRGVVATQGQLKDLVLIDQRAAEVSTQLIAATMKAI